MKIKKLTSFLLCFTTILSIISFTFTALAVSKPSAPTVTYVDSFVKKSFSVVCETLVDESKITNFNDNSQYRPNALCDGYQVGYSSNVEFTNIKYKTVKLSICCWGRYSIITVPDLVANKNYYVKLRSYNVDGDDKKYSDWSKVYKIKISSKNDPEVEIDNSSDKKKNAVVFFRVVTVQKCVGLDTITPVNMYLMKAANTMEIGAI